MDSRSDKKQVKGERPYNPDADLVRSFAAGCGVLILVFLCGWATIAWFWLR
jgi:hypothetical protein